MTDLIEVVLLNGDDGGVSADTLCISSEEIDVLSFYSIRQYLMDEWSEGRSFELLTGTPDGTPGTSITTQHEYSMYLSHTPTARTPQIFACKQEFPRIQETHEFHERTPKVERFISKESEILEICQRRSFAYGSSSSSPSAAVVGTELWVAAEQDIAVFASAEGFMQSDAEIPAPRHVVTEASPTALLYVPSDTPSLLPTEGSNGPRVWVGYAKGIEVIDPTVLSNRVPLLVSDVTALCYDGASTVYAGCADGAVTAMCTQPPQILKTCPADGGKICCLAATPRMVVFGNALGCLRVWDGGDVLCEVNGHDGWIGSIERSAGGATMWTSGEDATVRAWDVVRCPNDTPKATVVHRGRHTSPITSLLRQAGHLFASSLDSSISVYGIKDSAFITKINTPTPIPSLKLFGFTMTRTLWGLTDNGVTTLNTIPEVFQPHSEAFRAFSERELVDKFRRAVSEPRKEPCAQCEEHRVEVDTLKQCVANGKADIETLQGELQRAEKAVEETQRSADEVARLTAMEAAARKALQCETETAQTLRTEVASLQAEAHQHTIERNQHLHTKAQYDALQTDYTALQNEHSTLKETSKGETDGEQAALRALKREANTEEAHQKAASYLQADMATKGLHFEERMADMKEDIANEKLLTRHLQTELDSSESALHRLKEEMAVLQSSLDVALSTKGSLANECSETQTLLATTTAATYDLKRVAALKQDTIDELTAELAAHTIDTEERLEAAFQMQRDECRALRESHVADLAALKVTDVPEANVRIEELRMRVVVLEKQLEDASCDVETMQTYTASLEGHLKEADAKLLRASGHSDASVQRIRRFRDNRQLQQDVFFDLNLLQHDATLHAALITSSEAQTRCEHFLSFMHILQDNLAEASVTTDLLRLETFQWKNQAENTSKQDDLLSELAQTTEERDQLAEDIVLLQKDVACEHANAVEARTALEACRMRAGSELDKNKGEMEDAAAAIHRLEGIIEVTEAKAEDSQRELEAVQKKLADVQTTHQHTSRLDDKIAALETDRVTSERIRRALESAAMEAEENVHEMQTRTDTLERAVSDATRQIRDMREDHLDELASLRRDNVRTRSDLDASLAVEAKRLRDVQEDLEDVQTQRRVLLEQKNKLAESEADLQDTVLSLRREAASLGVELAAAVQERDTALQTLGVMQSDVEGKAAYEDKAREDVRTMQAQLAASRQTLTVNTAEMHALREVVATRSAAAEEAEASAVEAKRQQRAAEVELRAVQRQMSDATAASEALIASLRESEATSSELNCNAAKSASQASDMEAELERTRRKLANALAESQDSDTRRQKIVAELRSLLSEADATIAEKQRLLTTSDVALDTAQRDLRSLQQKALEAQERETLLAEALKTQAHDTDVQAASFRKQLTDMRDELDASRTRHRAAVASTDVENSAHAMAMAQVKTLHDTTEQQEQDIARHRQDLSEARSNASEAASTVYALKQSMADLQVELDTTKHELLHCQRDSEEAEARQKKLMSDMKASLEAELDLSTAQCTALKEALEEKDAEVAGLKTAEYQMRTDLTMAQASLSSVQQDTTSSSTTRQLEKELAIAETEFAAQQGLLQQKEEQLAAALLAKAGLEEAQHDLHTTLREAEDRAATAERNLTEAHRDLDETEAHHASERREKDKVFHSLQQQLQQQQQQERDGRTQKPTHPKDARHVEELEAEAAAAELALQKHTQRIERLEDSLKEVTRRADKAEQKAVNMEAHLTTGDPDDSVRGVLSDQEDALQESEERCRALEKELQKLETHYQSTAGSRERELSHVHTEADIRVAKAEARTESATARAEAIREELQEAIRSAASAESIASEANAKAVFDSQALERQKALHGEQLTSLRERVERAEHRADEAHSRSEGDLAAMRDAERRCTELSLQLRTVRSQLEDTELRLSDAEGRAAAASAKAGQSEQDLATAVLRRSEAEAAHSERAMHATELQQALERLTNELEETRRETLRAVDGSPRGAMADAQTRMHTAEGRIAALTHEANEARRSCHEAEARAQAAHTKAEAAHAQMASLSSAADSRVADAQSKTKVTTTTLSAELAASVSNLQTLQTLLDEERIRVRRAEDSELRLSEEVVMLQADTAKKAHLLEELRAELQAARTSVHDATAPTPANETDLDLAEKLANSESQLTDVEGRVASLLRERDEMAEKWTQAIEATEELTKERIEQQRKEFENTLHMARMDVEKINLQREHTEHDLLQARAEAQKLRAILKENERSSREDMGRLTPMVEEGRVAVEAELEVVKKRERDCRREFQKVTEDLLRLETAHKASREEVAALRAAQNPTPLLEPSHASSSPPPPTPESDCSEDPDVARRLPTSILEESKQEDYLPSEEGLVHALEEQLSLARSTVRELRLKNEALESAISTMEAEEHFEMSEMSAAVGVLEDQLHKARSVEGQVLEENASLIETINQQDVVQTEMRRQLEVLRPKLEEASLLAKEHASHMETCARARQQQASILQEMEMRLGDESNLRCALEEDVRLLRTALGAHGTQHPLHDLQRPKTRAEEERDFVSKTRAELVHAVWALYTDITKVQKTLPPILAAKRKSADVSSILGALRSLQEKLKDLRTSGVSIVANFFTPLEKLHCGAAAARFRPDDATLEQFPCVFAPPSQAERPQIRRAKSPPLAVSPIAPATVTRPLFDRKEISPGREGRERQQDVLDTPPTVLDKLSIKAEIAQLESKLQRITLNRSPTAVAPERRIASPLYPRAAKRPLKDRRPAEPVQRPSTPPATQAARTFQPITPARPQDSRPTVNSLLEREGGGVKGRSSSVGATRKATPTASRAVMRENRHISPNMPLEVETPQLPPAEREQLYDSFMSPPIRKKGRTPK